jgi:hypothetical protein
MIGSGIGKSLYRSDPDRFSRAWWLESVRNLVWVAVVTILIWVYADTRFTDRRTLVATIRLTAPVSSKMALISRGDVAVEALEKRVQFKIEGGRETLDRFEREFRDPVIWDVTRDHGPAEQIALDPRQILNADSQIASKGLRVIATEPSSFTIRLDRLVHETVPVELVVSGAELVAAPKAPPVGFTVPEEQWKTIAGQLPSPVLKTKEADLSGQPAGKTVEVEFEIFPEIAGIPVRLDQTTVKVPLKIKQSTAKKSFMVTVRVLTPTDWDDLRKYELVRKDPLEWRPEITVTGAKTDLDKLDPKDVEAYVQLREDDKKPLETWTSRAVTIRFPSDLQVRLDREPPQVNFRLDKRPAEPTPP